MCPPLANQHNQYVRGGQGLISSCPTYNSSHCKSIGIEMNTRTLAVDVLIFKWVADIWPDNRGQEKLVAISCRLTCPINISAQGMSRMTMTRPVGRWSRWWRPDIGDAAKGRSFPGGPSGTLSYPAAAIQTTQLFLFSKNLHSKSG